MSTPLGPPILQLSDAVSEGGHTVIARGEIDVSTAHELERAMLAASHGGAASVTLDLQGVTFIDSSGIQALIAGARRYQDTERDLAIVPSPSVLHVLELTGLEDHLPLAPPAS